MAIRSSLPESSGNIVPLVFAPYSRSAYRLCSSVVRKMGFSRENLNLQKSINVQIYIFFRYFKNDNFISPDWPRPRAY
jgi:hypothetical protein